MFDLDLGLIDLRDKTKDRIRDKPDLVKDKQTNDLIRSGKSSYDDILKSHIERIKGNSIDTNNIENSFNNLKSELEKSLDLSGNKEKLDDLNKLRARKVEIQSHYLLNLIKDEPSSGTTADDINKIEEAQKKLKEYINDESQFPESNGENLLKDNGEIVEALKERKLDPETKKRLLTNQSKLYVTIESKTDYSASFFKNMVFELSLSLGVGLLVYYLISLFSKKPKKKTSSTKIESIKQGHNSSSTKIKSTKQSDNSEDNSQPISEPSENNKSKSFFSKYMWIIGLTSLSLFLITLIWFINRN